MDAGVLWEEWNGCIIHDWRLGIMCTRPFNFFFFFFFCGSIDLARTLDMGTGLMILKPREHY